MNAAEEKSQDSRVAVITGAGSGIGRAVARLLLAEGWNVVLAGRRQTALEETAATSANPDRALPLSCDVSAEADVVRLFDTAVERFGRVDVLFNNAGVFGTPGEVDEIPVDDFEFTLKVNVTGSFLCAAQAVRVMKAQNPRGGRIINNGSISAHHPRPISAAYTVSKHAITGLTKQIELDGRAHGIMCGQIDIGNARTQIMGDIGITEGALQANGTRLVEPTFPVEEAARAVVFMASQPAGVHVGSMLIAAQNMPFIGRG